MERFVEFAPHVPPSPRKELDPGEIFVSHATESMRRFFPDYATVDRQRWDAYDEEADRAISGPGENRGNGRVLAFYRGEIASENPQVEFVRKFSGGHLLNAFNNPLGNGDEMHIAQPNSPSVYANPGGKEPVFWTGDEIDLSVETAQMYVNGIPLTPEVVGAPTFVVGNNDIVTMREILLRAQEYKQATRSQRSKLSRAIFTPKDIFTVEKESPEVAIRLADARLEFKKALGLSVKADGNERRRELLQTGVYSDILGISRGFYPPGLKLPDQT